MGGSLVFTVGGGLHCGWWSSLWVVVFTVGGSLHCGW